MNRKLLLLITIATLFHSCSTDFDVTAPYKEIPVVFGIINKDEAVQYIKINKAYLNDEGSAIIAGTVPDSNIYPYPIEAKLYATFSPLTELNNIKYVDSVVLDTAHLNKEAGNFNANNLFYKTPASFKPRVLPSCPATSKLLVASIKVVNPEDKIVKLPLLDTPKSE